MKVAGRETAEAGSSCGCRWSENVRVPEAVNPFFIFTETGVLGFQVCSHTTEKQNFKSEKKNQGAEASPK